MRNLSCNYVHDPLSVKGIAMNEYDFASTIYDGDSTIDSVLQCNVDSFWKKN